MIYSEVDGRGADVAWAFGKNWIISRFRWTDVEEMLLKIDMNQVPNSNEKNRKEIDRHIEFPLDGNSVFDESI